MRNALIASRVENECLCVAAAPASWLLLSWKSNCMPGHYLLCVICGVQLPDPAPGTALRMQSG